MIDALIQAAQTEVDNHSIYVWGGSKRRDAGARRYGRPLVINFIFGMFVGAVVGLLIAALMRAND